MPNNEDKMTKQPVIYGFGSACVDYRIHIPDMGAGYTAKVLADEIKALGGGACANCLVQAARLGAKCTYLGKLGSDPQAKLILDLFNDENIKADILIAEENVISPFNLAIYKGASNERVGGYLLPNSLGSITVEEAAILASKLPKGASVLVEIGEIPIKSVISFLQTAHLKGALIFMDVDLDPLRQLGASIEEFEQAIALADILIPNYEAVKDIFGISNRAELCRILNKRNHGTVIMTSGSEDIEFYDEKTGAGRIKIDKISDPADTVGAGDSFHGSLMFFMGLGYSLEKSIQNAAICAGLTCMGFGARTSMPYAEDVKFS